MAMSGIKIKDTARRLIIQKIRLIAPAIASETRMESSPPRQTPITSDAATDPTVTKVAKRARFQASERSTAARPLLQGKASTWCPGAISRHHLQRDRRSVFAPWIITIALAWRHRVTAFDRGVEQVDLVSQES
jgi:hypothetical protein